MSATLTSPLRREGSLMTAALTSPPTHRYEGRGV